MEAQAYAEMEALAGEHWWYVARFRIIADVLGRHLPSGASLLDFGAGMGVYAAGFRDRGWSVTAADVSDTALAACRAKGLAVIDLDGAGLAGRSFDGAVMGDVLEHVEDDVGALEKVAASVRPGGVILATVPAFELLWSGEDYVSHHLRRYTRSGLKRAILGAGLEPVTVSYFNFFLFPAVLAATLGARLFRPRRMYRSDIGPVTPWLNGLLTGIFAAERGLIGRAPIPVGASVLAVARVPGGG
jgi:SAM-dependent methyltransferase